jgi:hypothetical protein
MAAEAVCNPAIREHAGEVGERIRQEDGVGRAVEVIEAHAGRF